MQIILFLMKNLIQSVTFFSFVLLFLMQILRPQAVYFQALE